MTETAKIAANNAYSQNVAAADAAFAEGMSDLNNYVRTEQKAEQDEAYNSVMSVLASGSYHTAADLRTYLDTVKDKVSDTQWNELDRYVKTVEDSPEQKAAETARFVEESGLKTGNVYMDKNVGADWWGKGDNIRLSDGTNQYDVQIKEEIDGTDEIASGHSLYYYANAAKVGKNGVFSHNGNLYLRQGDKFYVLEQRTGSRAADWNDLLNLYK